MIFISKPVQLTVVQLGPCDRGQLENILDLANSVQRGFEFVFQQDRIETPSRQYRLRNGAWDLDGAIRDTMARRNNLRRPIIFLTSLPYVMGDVGSKTTFAFGDLGGSAASGRPGVLRTTDSPDLRSAGFHGIPLAAS